MSAFLKKSKIYFLMLGVMAFFGAIFLVVYFVYDPTSDSNIRNSTDNIANKVLLSKTEFENSELDEEWTKSEHLLIKNEAALFDQSNLVIKSPIVHSAYTKYFEIDVKEINEAKDSKFCVRGYQNKNDELVLLEEIEIAIEEIGLYFARFSYDHIFINQIEFVFTSQETSLSVAYLGIFSLQ